MDKVSSSNALSKDNSVLLSADELVKYAFAPGHIYYKGQIFIMKAGWPVEKSFLAKFLKKKITVDVELIIHPPYISELNRLFKGLNNSKLQKDRNKSCEKIVNFLAPYIWTGEKEGSFLDLILSVHESFYDLPVDLDHKLKSHSLPLFKRSAYMGSLMVVLGLSCGYVDFSFLKDIYHLAFFLDYGGDQNVMSYHFFESLESMRKGTLEESSGLGKINYSEEKFKKEALDRIDHIKDSFKEVLVNQQVIDLVYCHYEKLNGSGFPGKVNKQELSDIEAIVVLVSENVSYEEVNFESDDMYKHFKSAIGMNNYEENVRILSLLNKTFSKVNGV